MNLLRAEWQRFFARRFTRIMLALIAIVLAVIAVSTAHDSHRVTAADHVRARQQMASDLVLEKQQLTACQQAQSVTPVDPQYQLFPGQTCEDMFGGSIAPQESWYLPNTWTLAANGDTVILLFGGLFALFGFATGASFIGAEWHSGGMMNLLLWRPRRLALLTQKLAALLLSVLASGLALGLIWALLIWGLISTRGRLGHVTSGMWQSFALVGVRAFALGLIATVIGFAIASIGRHTATALGVAVGYVVIIEAGGEIFFRMLDVARPERFLLSRYLAAWMTKVQHFHSADICTQVAPGATQCSQGGEWVMRMGSAAEVVGIIAAALLVWAYASFWRRDVT